MQNEIWKDITIYNGIFKGKYQVSNLGRIKSLVNKKNPKILVKTINRKGYEKIVLSSKDKKLYTMEVHRIVAFEFVGGYEEGYECHHINRIRNDNRAENLMWLSKEEHKLLR